MTASTPRGLSNEPPSTLRFPSSTSSHNNAAGATAGVDIAGTSARLNRIALNLEPPPSLPCPIDDSSHPFPEALTLPVLVPRATKQRRRDTTDHPSATLMDFVSNMSLDEVRSATFSVPRSDNPFLGFLESTNATTSTTNDSTQQNPEELCQVATLRAVNSSNSTMPSSTSHPPTEASGDNTDMWLLTTPETSKPTISTPQALRLGSMKRKTPMHPPQSHFHRTPVDGNRPLMLPSVNTTFQSNSQWSSTTSQDSCQQLFQGTAAAAARRGVKRAKSYKNLLHSAPMLPSSPDLETRVRNSQPHYPFPASYFSPPTGVTLVNPKFIRPPTSTPSSASTSTLAAPTVDSRRMATSTVPLSTAGIPSLDDVYDDDTDSDSNEATQAQGERATAGTAPKWLRMKRRNSLLSALRLAATES